MYEDNDVQFDEASLSDEVRIIPKFLLLMILNLLQEEPAMDDNEMVEVLDILGDATDTEMANLELQQVCWQHTVAQHIDTHICTKLGEH